VATQVFRHQHRVSFSECTLGNHVYYARYLDFLERARGEFFRQLGAPFLHWQEKGAIFPVIECRLRYKAPARYDDVLTTEIWLGALGKVRLNFEYRIVNQSQTDILEGSTFHVCTGLDEKPRRLPEELRLLLQPYLAGVPDTQ